MIENLQKLLFDAITPQLQKHFKMTYQTTKYWLRRHAAFAKMLCCYASANVSLHITLGPKNKCKIGFIKKNCMV